MALTQLAPTLCALAFIVAVPVPETQFVATATPTHFEALNPNAFTVLMVLGNVAHGARAQMLIAPGASISTSFPSGTLDALYIEVVFFSPAGRVSSGAVSFDSMIGWDADALEVSLDGLNSNAWICTSGGHLPANSGVKLVPASLMNAAGAPTAPLMVDPTHVPAITPEDIDEDNVAPKIQGSNPPV